jgi:hypothetical protein
MMAGERHAHFAPGAADTPAGRRPTANRKPHGRQGKNTAQTETVRAA